MSTREQLETLGLSVETTGSREEAQLELSSTQLMNPLTRKFLDRVRFAVLGDRILVIEPPELVGIPPIALSELPATHALEERLMQGLNEHIYHLQRRSTELQTLGLSPNVEPETLQLSAEVKAGDFNFLIASDKRGNFRVVSARRQDTELTVSSTNSFELSEFRELSALTGYLRALFDEAVPRAPQISAQPLLALGEMTRAFGNEGLVPPRTALEVLVEVKVDGEVYRFAAARVHGHTFRGLLAGAQGKIWAERFELGDFPGVAALAARVLGVDAESVKLSTSGVR